jgi:hypothetical protein
MLFLNMVCLTVASAFSYAAVSLFLAVLYKGAAAMDDVNVVPQARMAWGIQGGSKTAAGHPPALRAVTLETSVMLFLGCLSTPRRV